MVRSAPIIGHEGERQAARIFIVLLANMVSMAVAFALVRPRTDTKFWTKLRRTRMTVRPTTIGMCVRWHT
jgi:hypothetical protein